MTSAVFTGSIRARHRSVWTLDGVWSSVWGTGEIADTGTPPLGLRLRVLLHGRSLDRQLATAESSPATRDQAVRARQLAAPKRRTRLACGLRRVVRDADESSGQAPGPAVSIDHAEVRRWREPLLGLAERLEHAGPANARGVARVALLLGDGASPLYNRDAEPPLSGWLWWIADGLQPCPPHAWDCPVVMKLDPEHVAWTCRRCGAIALSDDYSVRPS